MCCKPQEDLTTVVEVTATTTEGGIVLVEVIVLLVIMIVVVTETKLLEATTATGGIVASAVMAAETDGTALVEAELALLFDLALLSDGIGVAAVVLSLAVGRAVAASTAARREQADGSSIVARTTTLLFVVGRRKLDFSADGIKVRETTNGGQVLRVNVVPELGTVTRNLLHDDRVAELGQEAVDALDSSVGNLTLLEGTVHVPLLTNTTLDEVGNEFRTDKVDEGVTDIEVVGEINAKVREVVMTLRCIVEE